MDELRNKLIEIFDKMPDKPYLIIGKKSFTTKDLLKEVENKTKIGEELVENMLKLTLDLLSRQKINYE